MAVIEQLKAWAKRIRRDVHAIYIAAGDPRTPWYVKLLALFAAGYALSPIDLIPDFIPVLGLLDELILLPILIVLLIRLIPVEVMMDARAAALAAEGRPASRIGTIIIVTIWIAVAVGLSFWGWPKLQAWRLSTG